MAAFIIKSFESTTTRGEGGLGLSGIGGKRQGCGGTLIGGYGSTLIVTGGTGCQAPELKTPNHNIGFFDVNMSLNKSSLVI
jgi:hypothetical protein